MFSKGDIARVITTTSDIHEHTNDLKTVKRRDSQLLFGEGFKVELIDGDWVHGAAVNDGYEGFVALETLAPMEHSATHIVSNIMSHIYEEPTFKIRPSSVLSFKSEFSLSGTVEKGFSEVVGGGWIPEGHVVAKGHYNVSQIRDLALNFLSTPYIYGGRAALGLDCSGLSQVVLQACGVPCPRDSDQQLTAGTAGAAEAYKAGDLVFFQAHVGIMIDDTHILNATARTMDTRIEMLSDLERIYDGVLGYWRV